MEKHDTYVTPDYAWKNIKNYIPSDAVIWEAFYAPGGESGQILTDMGYEVIHKPYPQYDFFQYEPEHYTHIISNPPFSKSKQVLERLKQLNKPFIMIMPSAKLCTGYFRHIFQDSEDPIQIIIPRKRIHFKKLVNGEPVKDWKPACCFDCFYYCYKMNLPRDIVWLTDKECVEMKKKGNHKCNRETKSSS
tara:strand:+ start:235 stop:804 length:570 start_codon:yes stop_codon:yes gene_type:complete